MAPLRNLSHDDARAASELDRDAELARLSTEIALLRADVTRLQDGWGPFAVIRRWRRRWKEFNERLMERAGQKGAEFAKNHPRLAAVFGVVFAVITTLILIPTAYNIDDDPLPKYSLYALGVLLPVALVVASIKLLRRGK